VLLHFNEDAFAAVGVNIETDKVHISLCTYKNVLEEKIFPTSEIMRLGDNLGKLTEEIKKVIAECPKAVKILGIGVGLSGVVDEENGISVDSHGILPLNFQLLDCLKVRLGYEIKIVNNIKAQARALIKSRDDNFMLVKHSPGIGCAVVVNGRVVDGYNGMAGELGHTVVELNGRPCICGKRGCLETVASEKAVEDIYFEKTKVKKDITSIYAEYGKSEAADEIIQNLIERLALAIGNAAMLNDPKLVMVTGGVFFENGIIEKFCEKMDELGYGKLYKIKNIGNDKMIKAFAGARHILLEKLFEV
jgi:predicted NBD/HSP70 family sugar kinase